MIRRILKWGAIGVVGLFLLIQLVPYGRNHDNPPVSGEPKWDSAATRRLAVAACFDCHSNETEWPWYTNVAPMSWLVQHDVDEGRSKLNFSEWDKPQPGVDEVVSQVMEGGMPPLQYKVAHPASRLSSSEKRRLVAALRSLYAADPPAGVRGG